MAFVDESVVIGGVTFWPFQAIPMEANGSDQRQLNTAVAVTDVAGNPIILRSANTADVITSPLTSSAVNGVVPAFLASASTVKYLAGTTPLFVTSIAYINRQQVIDAQAAQVTASAASAATSASAAQAAQAAAEAAAAGSTGGTSVTSHGALTGLATDDHLQYARADGTRGAFAAPGHLHTGTYATPAELTSSSTADRNRANHSGVQPISSVSELAGALAGKEPAIPRVTTLDAAAAVPVGTIFLYIP